MPSPSLLWVKVCGIAAVQASISLAWVMYGLYIPKILTQAGFPAEFATRLLVIESLLAIALEPMMGALSERARVWVGARFPFIALGMGLAASLLILIPLLTIWGSGWGDLLGLLLPVVIVAWAIAMTMFRSPVLGLLAEYAVGSGLTQAVSIVILLGAIAGSTAVFARDWILSLGPLAAFAISSAVLVGAALVLHWSAPDDQTLTQRSTQLTPLEALPKRNLLWVFGVGAFLSLGLGLMRGPLQTGQESLGLVTAFTVAHLLSVLPAGWVMGRTGVYPALAVGSGVLALGLAGVGGGIGGGVAGSALGLAVLLGIAFSFVQNATIPFALSAVPGDRGALGVGMYFGGVSLAGMLLGQFGKGLTPPLTVGLGCMALAIAALWVGQLSRGESRR